MAANNPNDEMPDEETPEGSFQANTHRGNPAEPQPTAIKDKGLPGTAADPTAIKEHGI